MDRLDRVRPDEVSEPSGSGSVGDATEERWTRRPDRNDQELRFAGAPDATVAVVTPGLPDVSGRLVQE